MQLPDLIELVLGCVVPCGDCICRRTLKMYLAIMEGEKFIQKQMPVYHPLPFFLGLLLKRLGHFSSLDTSGVLKMFGHLGWGKVEL